jgi:hypothetical protein
VIVLYSSGLVGAGVCGEASAVLQLPPSLRAQLYPRHDAEQGGVATSSQRVSGGGSFETCRRQSQRVARLVFGAI